MLGHSWPILAEHYNLASIIQGSGLGPAAFLVTAADLRPIHDGNEILKYADDTYLVIPAANTHIGDQRSTKDIQSRTEMAKRDYNTLRRSVIRIS